MRLEQRTRIHTAALVSAIGVFLGGCVEMGALGNDPDPFAPTGGGKADRDGGSPYRLVPAAGPI